MEKLLGRGCSSFATREDGWTSSGLVWFGFFQAEVVPVNFEGVISCGY